ncbi:MAG: glycosyltransferase family 4 protein, partial [Candidatus Omnitrophota bacterium]
MIKVLFVANRPEILSGGQVSLLELLTRIDRLQLEPVVLIPGEGEMAERVRSMGITLLLWGMPTARMLNIGVIKRKVKELRSIVREQGVDIVHTNGSRAQFYASLAVKGTKARLVWHVREAKKDIPLYDLFLAASADKIICVSKAVKNKRFGLYPWLEPKIKVIYNGVDTNRFVRDDGEGERARKDLGINGDKKFLGTIGLLIPRKGHVFLFNALKTVVKKHPDIRFLILGKTVHESYTAGLRKKVWEMGIEKNILFKEPLNDINPVLSGLDIFV